jgi:hypothetical protein
VDTLNIILPNDLNLGVLGIAFHARPFKCALGSRKPIFPCNDGAFLAVQVPLSSEELLPQLIHRRRHHCCVGRRRPTPTSKQQSPSQREAGQNNSQRWQEPHLFDDEAQSGPASVLTRRDGSCRPQWLGLSLQGHLLWSPSLAITSNGAG